jgi:outer membrane autotransporter protein
VWFEGSTQSYKSDRTADYFGFNASIPAVSAGVQFDLGKDWFLGLAAGNSTHETGFSDNVSARIQGNSNQFGMSLKKVMGSTKIAAGLVGGYGEFNSVRRNILPFNTTASSNQNTSLFGAQLRISHDFEQPQWYLRPMLDLSLSKSRYEGFRETGAGALNLIVAEDYQTNPTISPSLEIGGEIRSGKVLIRPRAAIGYTRYLANPSPSVLAQFEGAPSNVQSFDVSSLADRDYLDISVDVNFLFQNRFAVTLGYWGQRSQHSGANAGFLKLLYSF